MSKRRTSTLSTEKRDTRMAFWKIAHRPDVRTFFERKPFDQPTPDETAGYCCVSKLS